MEVKPFWEIKALEQLSEREWEMLCDGCARCCLVKLEDADTGVYCYTRVACRYLDLHTCKCRVYHDRSHRRPGCVVLSAAKVREFEWLPDTCAYRRLAAGYPLAWWHPLISKDPSSIYASELSVKGQVVSELSVAESNINEYLIKGFSRRRFFERIDEPLVSIGSAPPGQLAIRRGFKNI
jgi:uncharacterized cysteine cluster protein YcgN (CxxCxxCC family)